jgi:hypothetical protein
MFIIRTATAIIAVCLMAATAWAWGGGASGAAVPIDYLMPAPPTGVKATACNGEASVSFLPPKSNGIKPITNYTVMSHPGRISVSGKQSPLTVRGLANGRVYNFTVTATNSIGTGIDSDPSNSVTPTADLGVCESQGEKRTQ